MLSQDYTNYLSENNLSIFLFHGVIEKDISLIRNYTKKHILKDDFHNFIASLKSKGTPLSLDTATNHILEKKPFPKNAFVITFDDGFYNNKSIAAEILNDLNVPATFYITTKFIDGNEMSWIDQIEYSIDMTKECELKLSFYDKTWALKNIAQKTSFLDDIRSIFKKNKNLFMNKQEMITEIFEKSRVKYINSLDDALNKKMSWKDVLDLNSNELFTIGGHTHTHPIMSFLSVEELESEINVCLGKIEERIKKKVYHFSYPEGFKRSYSKEIIKSLKDKSIKCSPSAICGVNPLDSDLFNLKRIMVQ